MNRYLVIGTLAGTLALSACAPSNHLHVMTELINGGQELPAVMVNTNLIATVSWDEVFAGDYPRPGPSTLFINGVKKGVPEYGLRVVSLELRLVGATFVTDGKYGFKSAAVIPDHIGRLKTWDLVEFRSTSTWRTMTDFTKKQEGNIIVRVLCRRADPDYEKCRDALPQIRNYPQGTTGTPYPSSLKDYGYTFTPAYDNEGKPTREIAEYVAK